MLMLVRAFTSKTKMLFSVWGVAVLLIVGAASPAVAIPVTETLDFSDLIVFNDDQIEVLNNDNPGYNGWTWSSSWNYIYDRSLESETEWGFGEDVKFLLNFGLASLDIIFDQALDILSADFILPKGDQAGSISFQGYGASFADVNKIGLAQSINVSTIASALPSAINLIGINRLRVNIDFLPDGQFAMDNLTYRFDNDVAAVPEPATFMLTGAGLLFVFIFSRKKTAVTKV